MHAHQNLPLAVATSVVAFEEGVTRWTPPWPDWAPGPVAPMEPFVAVATLQDYGAGRICSRSRAPPTCWSSR